MRWFAVILGVALVTLGMAAAGRPAAIAAASPTEDNVRFSWAFEALVQKDGAQKPVAIKHDTVLKTGDKLRMLIELQKPCFVYLIYRSPQGDVSLLLPYNQQQFGHDYETAKTYYIPQSGGWFELDEQVGSETFYLLASSQRLLELEQRLNDYAAADGARKPALADQIVATIRQIRRRHRQFTTVAERPATIAGNLRLSSEAVNVSTTDFYGKTFTIDHR
jgi:hypothetical protein